MSRYISHHASKAKLIEKNFHYHYCIVISLDKYQRILRTQVYFFLTLTNALCLIFEGNTEEGAKVDHRSGTPRPFYENQRLGCEFLSSDI